MKRSMLLAVLALVGLTVTGVAYAAWTQNITVQGNVSTGTFDIKWTNLTLDRSGEPTFEGNYVAQIEDCSVTNDGHTIRYRVTKAFPGWSSKIRCTIKNAGTTPAALSFDPGEGSTLVVEMSPDVTGYQLGVDGEKSVEIAVRVPYGLGEESEDQTYSFTLTVNGTQWHQESGQ
ncbi:MAG: hypothetical protein ACOX5Q_09785 [Bacillota bacterium]|jgi:hypothetical protein|nr:hypothetical protein [Candidatus Fermentithermobacillaceae bacterium]